MTMMPKENKLVFILYILKYHHFYAIVKDQYGDIIDEILESQNNEFPPGTRVWAKVINHLYIYIINK